MASLATFAITSIAEISTATRTLSYKTLLPITVRTLPLPTSQEEAILGRKPGSAVTSKDVMFGARR